MTDENQLLPYDLALAVQLREPHSRLAPVDCEQWDIILFVTA
ncbi:MAG: hypothetical protein V7K47_17035 [Nostoc sp.]